ncbi:MAG: type II toxin-antitoxin system death-on-curing family toxin [Lactobacillus kefiranofaciens]
MIERAGKGSIGIQYTEGIDIIVKQPKQVLFGHELYPTIWLKAAFILQKITKKHIFADGNKRTALVATTFFLTKNGYQVNFTKDEGLKFILFVTNSDDTEEVMKFVADWLKSHSRKIN